LDCNGIAAFGKEMSKQHRGYEVLQFAWCIGINFLLALVHGNRLSLLEASQEPFQLSDKPDSQKGLL